MTDDKIVDLDDKLRAKAAMAQMRRSLDKLVHKLRDYATRAEIAKMLRDAVKDLQDDGQKSA